ncbi:fibro-slime domain-containing protein [Sorangium sp. So ce1000]|uniref:fibro-slime domain-containing protein n=1 Tax=Sorangium sp. So ce1000 TaxID=3133325 RepID=UPI003F5DBC00
MLALAGCAPTPEYIGRESDVSASGSEGGFPGGSSPQGSSGAGGGGEADCKPRLEGIVRDFKSYGSPGGHPDFERFVGEGLPGIVEPVLGDDLKPVYAHPGATEYTTGRAEFDQWFRDDPEVSRSIHYTVPLDLSESALRIFFDKSFFPIDGDDRSWGNQGESHNYSFTFELHMTFRYRRGDVFIFGGDDDIWVFIDRKLVIDMGGVHPPASATLELDELARVIDLKVGGEYPIDIFFAERHSPGSQIMFTTLEYTNCEPILR